MPPEVGQESRSWLIRAYNFQRSHNINSYAISTKSNKRCAICARGCDYMQALFKSNHHNGSPSPPKLVAMKSLLLALGASQFVRKCAGVFPISSRNHFNLQYPMRNSAILVLKPVTMNRPSSRIGCFFIVIHRFEVY